VATPDQRAARGDGVRESGAFLLASGLAPEQIAAFVMYDDLDATCLTGGISFSGAGYTELWRRCREQNVKVVADVHTHPSSWVQQSDIDRKHPMIPQAGHVAVIVPEFAYRARLDECGVYVYQGGGGWMDTDRSAEARALLLTSMPAWHRFTHLFRRMVERTDR
jgi:proteasome lid subunit RPN8/RPN11